MLTINVSKFIPNTCTNPSSISFVFDEDDAAIAPVPSPASVEKIDLVHPTTNPVIKLFLLNASFIIRIITSSISTILFIIIIKHVII